MKKQFIFYFGSHSVFSHWYKCNFQIEGQNFCCIDQYLMYNKAILFDDKEIAFKILHSTDPKRHRYSGRKVKNFSKQIWHQHCKQFAYEANHAKFTQNKNLQKHLVETIGKCFAEASPYDRNWGIGLSQSNPKNIDRNNWRGKNWCGEVLEAVRKNIFS